MAREVNTVHRFDHQSHKFGLPKDKIVMRCDDGAIYEFEQAQGQPRFRLVRRFDTEGVLSTSRGVLPAAVKEEMNGAVGKEGWSK